MNTSREKELEMAQKALAFYQKKQRDATLRLTKTRTSTIDFTEKIFPAGPGEQARSMFEILFGIHRSNNPKPRK